jgi:Tfp pilus assembly protein PilO
MSRAFNWPSLNFNTTGLALWLRVAVVAAAILNLVAIGLYLMPPGGSRHDLVQQEEAIRRDTQVRRGATERLKLVSHNVELGGEQTQQFAAHYFLPRRTAYAVLVTELIRLSNEAGLQEGQRTYSEEPVEGTNNLTLLTINANYQGSYVNLMKFVNQVDHSDQLLILDTLNASPQQQGSGVLTMNMRFLSIVTEDATLASGSLGGHP